MSMELILSPQFVIVSIVVLAITYVIGFTILGVILYRMWEQTSALGAANSLQGREMKAILLEVREELARHR